MNKPISYDTWGDVINRFKANEMWFTSEDNKLEDVENAVWGIRSIYSRRISAIPKQPSYFEYAFVSWTHGSAMLVYVLSNGAFFWADEYLKIYNPKFDEDSPKSAHR